MLIYIRNVLILIILALTFALNADASRIREIDVQSIAGELNTANSSTTPLGVGGTFTGTAHSSLNHAIIFVSVFADQQGTLKIQQSHDATNWDFEDSFEVPGNTGKNFSLNPFAQYMRVIYVNNGVAQTEFRLQTLSKSVYAKPSSHKLGENVSSEDDAELVKANITGENPDGDQRNVGVTASGNLKTSDAENGLAIARGDVTGTTFEHKFGNAPDFDSTDLTVTVWDGAEDATAWENMVYDYSTTADIDSISSSSAGDTQEITVEGLDINYNIVTQTKTLNGQTRVALDTPLFRCYRAYNSNATNLVGHVFVYVNGALTGGVPNNNADIRAIIDPINQQTEMALYTVPAGKTGYMRSWYAATAGASKNANYFITLKSREATRVFRVKHTSALNETGTSAYQHTYVEPEVFPEKTDIEMTVSILGTGVTAASVSAGFDMVLVDN
jgi:hypothetical protein